MIYTIRFDKFDFHKTNRNADKCQVHSVKHFQKKKSMMKCTCKDFIKLFMYVDLGVGGLFISEVTTIKSTD